MSHRTVNNSPAGAGRIAIPLWIIAGAAAIFLLRAASQLLIPIVVAVLISYALEPVVAWMERRRIPRMAGAGMVLLLILGTFGWGAYTLSDDAVRAVQALPQAAQRARETVVRTTGIASLANLGQAQGSGGSTQAQGSSSSSGGPSMESWMQRAVSSIFSLAGHATVVVFLVYFLLISRRHFSERALEIAATRGEKRVTAKIIDDINGRIQRFLLVTVFTAAVVGLATWPVLAWMGIQQPAVWGILAGVFNSIPYFGPVIVSGGLLAVGIVQSGDPMLGVRVAGAALVITSLEGWLLTPPLMGKAERMHVLVVFLGLLLWTWIWGAWGTILAVPMLVVVKSIADHLDPLKPISRLMAP